MYELLSMWKKALSAPPHNVLLKSKESSRSLWILKTSRVCYLSNGKILWDSLDHFWCSGEISCIFEGFESYNELWTFRGFNIEQRSGIIGMFFFWTLLTIQRCWDACGLFNVEKDYRKELLRIAQTIQASSQLNRRMPTKGLQIQYLNNFKLIFWTFVMVCIILNGERCNIISIAIRILSDVL